MYFSAYEARLALFMLAVFLCGVAIGYSLAIAGGR
jgi:hypothetical protein